MKPKPCPLCGSEDLSLRPDDRGIEWDLIVSDLTAPKEGRLSSLVEQIQEKWYPDCAEQGEMPPRCGTVYVCNTKNGNGEIRVVLRFPLDIEALRVEDEVLKEKGSNILKKLLRRATLRVVGKV